MPADNELENGAPPEPAAPRGRQVLLSVEDAARVYPMGEVEVHALREARLEVLEGEFLIIQGPSGCGKSTLLNLLGGMDRATSGTVRFRGEDLGGRSDHARTLYRRHQVGFVFQFYNLVPTLTAVENVQVATEIARAPRDPREALELVDLADRAGHFPSQLSGGQQQRVAIARALATNPEFLLCDEPTGALDLTTSRQVLRLLLRVNEELGKTVVLVTHNTALSALGHRVALMRDGSIREVRVQDERPDVESVEW